MNRIRSLSLTVLAAIALPMIATSPVVGCPTCKFGLHSNVALGYAISILFMMGMPFLIFGFWSVAIIRLRRQMRQQESGSRPANISSTSD